MKKILYLHAGAELYGADKVLLELIKGLDKNEFEAHVILPNDGVLVPALREVGAQVEVINYPILRRKYFNPKGIFDYFISYHHYSKQIAQYAIENKVDIIHNNTTAVLEGIYLKRKLKLPLLWHVHEIIVKPKFISDSINFLMGRFADKIVTVSQAVANHIKQSPHIKDDQISVIYNGVDNKVYYQSDARSVRERFDIDEEALVIGMVGRVNAWKGQGDFLEAVAPILEQNPKAIAFIAGSAFEGEEWRVVELEKKISQLKVSSQVRRIDYYANTTELYNMFDIFVLPSTNPDPLPTVVLEAMACGKPVVGYRHGGVCEMVKEGVNGFLVTPNSPLNLSKVILQLSENINLQKKIGNNSIERQKEHFSLKSYVKNFSKVYTSLKVY
ncbi:glycosyltransferase family 4 protein [Streptococcus suis]|uniref:glycosyltransferase family 4 protein n=1 Tax=Streptococcus suis TaxID=1307 RepID=UPI0005CEE5EF|nr:glycosyltransferase family 4 protein [Streptococcus suis]NRG90973.1 glycosyltransferase family 4 protein [Streptococcus suis]CZB10595.1 glycosyltransferase [Streptococcus suis]